MRWKTHLARRLYERGYQRQDILELFRFIDWDTRGSVSVNGQAFRQTGQSGLGDKLVSTTIPSKRY